MNMNPAVAAGDELRLLSDILRIRGRENRLGRPTGLYQNGRPTARLYAPTENEYRNIGRGGDPFASNIINTLRERDPLNLYIYDMMRNAGGNGPIDDIRRNYAALNAPRLNIAGRPPPFLEIIDPIFVNGQPVLHRNGQQYTRTLRYNLADNQPFPPGYNPNQLD